MERVEEFCRRLNIKYSEEVAAFLAKGEPLLAEWGTQVVDRERLTAFPIRSDGKGVYTFLFHCGLNCPAADLPEDNSMQRGVKTHLMQGGIFYDKGGVFF